MDSNVWARQKDKRGMVDKSDMIIGNRRTANDGNRCKLNMTE